MRVFVAGATGAIGTRLVAQLIAAGHEVVGSSRSLERASQLRAYGAEPVALDLLDPTAVREVVAAARPDAVVHQATALTGVRDFKHFDRSFAQTNKLRTAGTDALLAAAREAGVSRFVAQSFASNRYAREGGPVKSEEDPLDPNPPSATRESQAAMIHLERATTDAGGITLRYGASRPPRRVPVWLGRLVAGEAPVVMSTQSRGASNAKAKRELGWKLRYPTWRAGFREAYTAAKAA